MCTYAYARFKNECISKIITAGVFVVAAGVLLVATGGVTPGFHSSPVAVLYFALRARRALTSRSSTALSALADFKSRTFVPWTVIFSYNSAADTSVLVSYNHRQ